MNRAELLQPGSYRLRPPPVAVSFNTNPAKQMAADCRLLGCARQGDRDLHIRVPSEAYLAARELANKGATLSKVLPAPKPWRVLTTPAAVRPMATMGPPALKHASQIEVKNLIASCADPLGLSAKQIAHHFRCGVHNINKQLRRLIQQGHVWRDGTPHARRYHPAS